MKLYEYWLGLHPLDWEFCFMPVQAYKNVITEQYHKNPSFYNISAGSIEQVLAHIILSGKPIRRYTYEAEL